MGNLGSNATPKIVAYNEALRRSTPDELARWRKIFDRWTTTVKKGDVRKIDKNLFFNEVLSGQVPRSISDRMFAAFDTAKSGFLTEKDFICAMAIFFHGRLGEKVQFLFEVYDIKQAGSISIEDMTSVFLSDVILQPGETKTKEQLLLESFQRADQDRDQKLTFKELEQWARDNRDLTSLTRWIFTESIVPADSSSAGRESMRASAGQIIAEETKTPVDTNDLTRIFNDLHKKSKSGRFDKETLRNAFPPGMPDYLVDRIFACFDDNLDGSISAEEFICGVSPFCRGELDDKLEFWFKIFDGDRDGRLSRPEMLGVVTSVWRVLGLGLTAGDATTAPAGPPSSQTPGPSSEEQSTGAASSSTSTKDINPETKARMTALIDSCFQQFNIEPTGSISFEQYKTWAKQDTLAQQFLGVIERMSKFYLGVRPDHPEEEKNIIQELMDAETMKEGDNYYVLSSKWWRLWCDRVNWRNDSADAGREIELGAIDNSNVVLKKSPKTLRANLSPDQYIALPKKVWTLLYFWYGGGPVLRRLVIRNSSGGVQVELWPLRLNVVVQRTPTMSSKPTLITCSTSFTVEKLCGVLKKRFVLGERNIQVWNALESRPTLLRDMAQTLEDAELVHGQKIIVEVQQENSQWPLDVVSEATSSQIVTQPGIVGLFNIGNTCFMNASIQCLSNTPPLRHYFSQGYHLTEINRTNPLGHQGAMAKSFGELLRRVWVGDARRFIPSAIAPRRLRSEVARIAPHLGDFSQHDATEFLTFLIDGLHEDLNRVINKQATEGVDSNGRPDAVVADEAWEQMRLRDQSIIVDSLTGSTKSNVVCDVCGNSSVRFDPFRMLSVPLPLDKKRAIAVKLHWLDPFRKPVKFGLFIERTATLAQVKRELFPLCGLPPDKLIFAEAYGHYFYQFWTDFDSITRAVPRDLIHAYEVVGAQAPGRRASRRTNSDLSPAAALAAASGTSSAASSSASSQLFGPSTGNHERSQEEVFHVPVVHRYLDRQDVYLLSPHVARLFGVPFILSLAASERSVEAITAKIWEQLLPRIKTPQRVYGQFSDFEQEPALTTSSHDGGETQSQTPPSATTSSSSSISASSEQPPLTPDPAPYDPSAPLSLSTPKHRKRSSKGKKSARTGSSSALPAANDSESDSESDGEFANNTFALDAKSPDRLKLVRSSKKKRRNHVPKSKRVQAAKSTPTPVPAPAVDKYVEELMKNPPFQLKVTNNQGKACDSCPWSSFCLGCPLRDGQIRHHQTIVIEWDRTTVRKYYDSDGLRDVIDHPSLEEVSRLETQPIDLEDCFSVFTQTEHLTNDEVWRCGRCADFRPATKKIEVWRAPPVLFVQLKRFYYNGHSLSKIPKLVIFPLEGLDIAPYSAETAPRGPAYDLYAVLNHFGGLSSGHYVAYARHPDDHKWRVYDDSRVSEMSSNDIVTTAAYLLCYIRRDLNQAEFSPSEIPTAFEFKDFAPESNHRCSLQ